MTEIPRSVETQRPVDTLPGVEEHPRGTLAIVCIFGLLFALAWIAMYVLVFLQRGAPHA
jgi:hypothetical protein